MGQAPASNTSACEAGRTAQSVMRKLWKLQKRRLEGFDYQEALDPVSLVQVKRGKGRKRGREKIKRERRGGVGRRGGRRRSGNKKVEKDKVKKEKGKKEEM